MRPETALLGSLDATALAKNPNPALLLADCLEIAHARELALGEFIAPLIQACERAGNAPIAARARLWETRGRLGADQRPGVGLDAEGLPDIDAAWCPVPGGKVNARRQRRDLRSLGLSRSRSTR